MRPKMVNDDLRTAGGPKNSLDGDFSYHPARVSLRVALISDWYIPRLGGIEVQIAELSRRLRENGNIAHVFTTFPGPFSDDANSICRVPGLRLPHVEVSVSPFLAHEMRRRLDGKY